MKNKITIFILVIIIVLLSVELYKSKKATLSTSTNEVKEVTHVATSTTPVKPIVKATSQTKNVFIKVVSPNGGENIAVDSLYPISWQSSGISKVKIFYIDDTDQCSPFITSCSTGFNMVYDLVNKGSYTWDTSKKLFGDARPNSYTVKPGFKYKIKVCDNNGKICDLSDDYFYIVASSTQPDINIIEPNGNDDWSLGSKHIITMDISGDPLRVGSKVQAFISDPNNNNRLIFENTKPATVGKQKIEITIPVDTNPGKYRILVILYKDNLIQAYDYTDDYFNVVKAARKISVANTEQNWKKDKVQKILWTSENVSQDEFVSIELRPLCPRGYVCTPSSNIYIIAKNILNSGFFDWSVGNVMSCNRRSGNECFATKVGGSEYSIDICTTKDQVCGIKSIYISE